MDGLIALVPAEFAPSRDLVVPYGDAEPDADLLARTGLFVPNYAGAPANLGWIGRMPRLERVQLPMAGYEHALAHVPPAVALSNAVGVHDASTAELALGLILASLRQIDVAARAMTARSWFHPSRATSLADREVLVIGAGGVGRAIEARLLPFEARVAMVARTARDGVRAAADLPALLGQADIVVLAVPHDRSTEGMVDAEFLGRMRPGALLVNVSRGPVVATDALMAALDSGAVRAALDVTDPEPLPADHPLWQCPGLLITGHVGGDSTAFAPRMRRLVDAQVRRWQDGERPLHLVHR